MPEGPILRGTIHLPEVSGAEVIGGDRLLLVSDEHGVYVADDACAQLLSGAVRPRQEPFMPPCLDDGVRFDDGEDAAWDGRRYAYLASSHSRNRRGRAKRSRHRLARLEIDGEGRLTEVRHSEGLWWGILSELGYLARAALDTPARGGLNIEGLAVAPDGDLIIGLRSPTITHPKKRTSKLQEDAIVLRVGNPGELFDDQEATARFRAGPKGRKLWRLDLGGQGVRALRYDPDLDACWVLSGLSADPNHDVRNVWGLWLWNGKRKVRRARFPERIPLRVPEAVCRIRVNDRPCLLIIEDREVDDRPLEGGEPAGLGHPAEQDAGSPYVLVPIDELEIG